MMCHVAHCYGQKSKAYGAALLAVARHGLDGDAGDYQVEPRVVPRAPTRVRQVGMVHWGDTLGTLSDSQGKSSLLGLSAGC